MIFRNDVTHVRRNDRRKELVRKLRQSYGIQIMKDTGLQIIL